MILETQKQADVLTDGEELQESISMSLDLDSAQVLMQMLSRNIYQEPIGSLIREQSCNSLDSSRLAKSSLPIIVSLLQTNEGNYEFSVEDFGAGLDDKDVKNIISKYGASTKRGDNLQIGCYGIGFKSPLSYASSFYFIARKDGMERKYMMYEGEEVNSIDLLYVKETEEPNGVKVVVPVNYRDRWEFENKIKQQLAYFENVYFNVRGVDNSFKIHRSDNFQWSELNNDGRMHLTLDNVYYPLDFAKLGIPVINIPIALRFKLGDGLFPTINRESIRITSDTIRIIKAKIAEVADELVDKYNEKVREFSNVMEYISWRDEDDEVVKLNEKSVSIRDILKYSTKTLVKPSIKDVKLLNLDKVYELKDTFLCEYSEIAYIRNGKYSETNNDAHYRERRSYYIANSSVTGFKKDWFKTSHVNNGYVNLIRKNSDLRLFKKIHSWRNYSYFHILQLHAHPRSEWRERIKEWQMLKQQVIDSIKSYDDLVVPQSWIDLRKAQRSSYVSRDRKAKGEISLKEAQPLERYVDGKSCKFVPTVRKLESLYKTKGLTIYTSHDNSDKINNLYYISPKRSILLITLSDRERKALESLELHNFISYEKFMEGENKPFKRIVTAYLIYKLKEKNPDTFSSKGKFINQVSSDLAKKLETLEKYQRDWYYPGSNAEDTARAMLQVAEEYNLFDEEMYSLYNEVKKTLDENSFIEVLSDVFPMYGNKQQGVIDVAREMFKNHHLKLNYK